MSEPVSALSGREARGTFTVRDRGPRGMITVKGDLSDKEFRKACTGVTGTDFPDQRRVAQSGDMALGWMAPDEVLIMVPRAGVSGALAALESALAGTHHLAVDVSDARAVIGLEGPAVREGLARLTPADLHPAGLPTGELRRTRIGQVAAAFWLKDAASAEVICFRSVAAYVFDLLANAAQGEAVGHLPDG